MPTTRSQNAKQKRLMTGVPEKNQEIPQFYFRHTALQLELLVFSLVISLREANFALYVDCLTKLTPWFFSLDLTSYAKMGASPYSRHGQSKHNQTRNCHGVHEWQLHCSQNQQSVVLHGSGPGT